MGLNKSTRRIHPKNEVTILILGKTGTGKSSLGNLILGKKAFKTGVSGKSITTTSSTKNSTWILPHHNDDTIMTPPTILQVNVTDTPCILNTLELLPSICFLKEQQKFPDAFVFVINVLQRFTKEEQNAVDNFVFLFGEEICKQRCVIVFTHKDELDEKNVSIHEYVKNSPPMLKNFIQQCDKPYFAINNRTPTNPNDANDQKETVNALLKMILQY